MAQMKKQKAENTYSSEQFNLVRQEIMAKRSEIVDKYKRRKLEHLDDGLAPQEDDELIFK
jgi:hypothetical protein